MSWPAGALAFVFDGVGFRNSTAFLVPLFDPAANEINGMKSNLERK
jgi:hypothetical protein